MNLRASTRLLFLLATMTICTTVLHANAITGSLPFAEFNVTQNGADLTTSTIFTGTDSLTSSTGKGDFSMISAMTPFSGFTLMIASISGGGGFSISNPSFGNFMATGGSIQHQTANGLVVDLTGTYIPGSSFPGLTATPADATLGFTQNGSSISASFTLAMIPEPATMVTMGIGLCVSALALRRKLAMS